MCDSDDGCTLTVSQNSVTKKYSGTSTGGEVTVTVVAASVQPDPQPTSTVTLPPGNSVHTAIGGAGKTGTVTVKADEYQDFGGVRFTCPPGGSQCVVTIKTDLTSTTATTTGGTGSGATATAVPVPPAVSRTLTGVDANNLQARIADAVVGTAAELDHLGFPSNGSSGQELKDPDNDTDSDTPSTLKNPTARSLGDWSGMSWASDKQVLVRYTDRAAPESMTDTFMAKFGSAKGDSDNIDSSETGFWKHAKSDMFPDEGTALVGSNKKTFRIDTAFGGSFADVDGKFTCTGSGTGCVVTNDDGVLDVAPGYTMTFETETPGASVTYEVMDADYLAFGWWRESRGSNQIGIVDFTPLYRGRHDYNGIIDSVTGTAKYEGYAVGNYAKVTGPKLARVTEGGEFVADAMLTAKFDDANNPLEGSIKNFRSSSGGNLGKWELELGVDDLDSSSKTLDSSSINGTADGVSWSANRDGAIQFYGDGTGNRQPSSVAGWFRATTAATVPEEGLYVGVAGSFGAHKQ